jgi:hypothetical protein
MVCLAGGLVFLGEDALDLAEVDVDIAVPLPLIVPDYYLADLRLILGVLGVAGDFAQRLPRGLLGEHDGLQVEFAGIHRKLEDVADLGLVAVGPRLFERYLEDRIVEFLDDGLFRVYVHALVLFPEADDGVLARSVFLLVGGEERLLDRLYDEVLGYALLADELPYRFGHFGSHRTYSPSCEESSLAFTTETSSIVLSPSSQARTTRSGPEEAIRPLTQPPPSLRRTRAPFPEKILHSLEARMTLSMPGLATSRWGSSVPRRTWIRG